jgi:hypothetical protein
LTTRRADIIAARKLDPQRVRCYLERVIRLAETVDDTDNSETEPETEPETDDDDDDVKVSI